MVEILIRDHVPEWADEIDFSTLREEPTELVSRKTPHAFMVERMGTMLRLRNYPEELKLGGAKTMTEMAERFHRSLDELVQRGARQGQTMVLRRLIARRFGEETAGQVSDVLEELPGPEGIDRVTDAVIECGTGEEFIERVRTA